MHYQITGLDPSTFSHLFGLSDEELHQRGIDRHFVTEANSSPCRVSLEDAEPGEELLLLGYAHLPENSPYRAHGPIFVRRQAVHAAQYTSTLPEMLRRRLLSVRAYDAAHRMVDADVVAGVEADGLIKKFFAQSEVAYLHVHFARRGCFAVRVDRVAG